MKYAEFTALCQQEWLNGHGDLTGLSLTDESYQELAVDAIIDPAVIVPTVLRIREEDLPAMSAGELTELVNPVTRSTVRAVGGASIDMMQISRPAVLASEPAPL